MRPLLPVIALAVALGGCATLPPPAADLAPAQVARPTLPAVEPALDERVLALDPEHVTADDVRTLLSRAPAPRVMLLHGGIYPVHLIMASFGRFLAAMGYPADRIRDPGTKEWSYSPYQEATELAGIVAWEYERSGMRPMMIGHSQGGIQAVKVLRELDGQMTKPLHVFNPVTGRFESRTTIVDPLTGSTRDVIGVQASYVSSVGAGGAAFLLPNQWSMVGHLYSIPNTVVDFTGFDLGIDLIAWTIGDGGTYRHNGNAKVRNVTLPATYNHVVVPAVQDLAKEDAARRFIDAYSPGRPGDPSVVPMDAQHGLLYAADVWWDVKKHWVLELQRLIRAERQRAPGTSASAVQ